MSNDLLKQLEAKINEAIETIEFSRMEITDLKEKNDELENRYEDWEQRLSSLIEKFEQLEDVEAVEVEAEVDTSIQKDEEAEEVVAEEAEAEEVEAEEVVAVETEDEEAEDEAVDFPEEEKAQNGEEEEDDEDAPQMKAMRKQIAAMKKPISWIK